MFDDLYRTQTGFHEIIGMLAAINCYCNNSKQQHAKDESDKEFFKYVPVDFFDHEGAKINHGLKPGLKACLATDRDYLDCQDLNAD